MNKILYLPLERPAIGLSQELSTDKLEIIAIPQHLKATKNKGTALTKLNIKDFAKEANGLVISLDMLIYGGLIPSRCTLKPKTLIERQKFWKKSKRKSDLQIFGYAAIMRLPNL